MPEQIKNKILDAAKIVGAITIIQGGLIAIATPFVNEHIEQRIKDYHNSAEFKVYVDNVIEDYRNQSQSTVSLRELLSDKMGVPSDEVHIKIGEMYRQMQDIKIKIKDIISDINYYHPTTLLVP
jgi:AraC-like DNA-binding protein